MPRLKDTSDPELGCSINRGTRKVKKTNINKDVQSWTKVNWVLGTNMDRDQKKKKLLAAKRLFIAREITNDSWDELANGISKLIPKKQRKASDLNAENMKKWVRQDRGMPLKWLTPILRYYNVAGKEWVFTDERLSTKNFKEIIYNPDLADQLMPERETDTFTQQTPKENERPSFQDGTNPVMADKKTQYQEPIEDITGIEEEIIHNPDLADQLMPERETDTFTQQSPKENERPSFQDGTNPVMADKKTQYQEPIEDITGIEEEKSVNNYPSVGRSDESQTFLSEEQDTAICLSNRVFNNLKELVYKEGIEKGEPFHDTFSKELNKLPLGQPQRKMLNEVEEYFKARSLLSPHVAGELRLVRTDLIIKKPGSLIKGVFKT